MTNNNDKAFVYMSDSEQRSLIASLRDHRTRLRLAAPKKRRGSGKRKGSGKRVKFEDPTLQALFDQNEVLQQVLRRK